MRRRVASSAFWMVTRSSSKSRWLTDEIVSSKFKSSLDVVQLRVGGNHDDRRRVRSLLDLFENLDAAEVGHADVEQDEVRRLVLGEAEAGISGGGFDQHESPDLVLLDVRMPDISGIQVLEQLKKARTRRRSS